MQTQYKKLLKNALNLISFQAGKKNGVLRNCGPWK